MSIANREPFLITSREFPEDNEALLEELSKTYIDIAKVVNERTIGIYGTVPAVTGNTWFTQGPNRKNQTLRQVYPFVGGTNPINIPHNIRVNSIAGFVNIYGTFTDGTNWYPLPYTDTNLATNQVSVIVDPTNIVIRSGAGTPPTISSGFVVLEWLSNP